MNLFSTDNSDEKDNKKIQYIINNGKIIFSYEYCLNENENKSFPKNYYNLLICKKENIDNIIETILIYCFENKKEERNSQFLKYTTTQFFLGKEIGDIDEGIILKRPLKKKDSGNDFKIAVEFFKAKNKFEKKLKQKIVLNLKDAKEKEYYIIDSKWMVDFRKFFIIKQIKKMI